MLKTLFLFIALVAALAGSAHATESPIVYKPGSVGYLYEDCRKVLSTGTELKNLYESYCGSFVEGFFTGAMIAHSINIPPPSPQDPCAADKQKEYDRITNRLCKNLPQYEPKTIKAGEVLGTVGSIVTQWVEFQQKTNPKSDPLAQPATAMLGEVLQPGKFCDTLGKNLADDSNAIFINPPLFDLGWKDYLAVRDHISIKRKYDQCLADYNAAKDESTPFKSTRCSAEITGFIAGLGSTSNLQDREPPANPACGKELDRLYRSLDMRTATCVEPGTDPMLVAHIFLERVENMPGQEFEKSQKFVSLKSLGAVGYESIYRGFLCARKN